jgi:hypothetical protein
LCPHHSGLGCQRPWTYHAHIAAENIDKLWQLVEMRGAQPLSERCYAKICLISYNVMEFFALDPHGSELEDGEEFSSMAYSFLLKNGRTTRCALHQQGN